LTIERLHIGIVLWRLVEQTIAIDVLEFWNAELHLERDGSGDLGLERLLPTQPEVGDATDQALRLDLRAFEASELKIRRLQPTSTNASRPRFRPIMFSSRPAERLRCSPRS
jgi:hypothetical protein